MIIITAANLQQQLVTIYTNVSKDNNKITTYVIVLTTTFLCHLLCSLEKPVSCVARRLYGSHTPWRSEVKVNGGSTLKEAESTRSRLVQNGCQSCEVFHGAKFIVTCCIGSIVYLD